MRIAKIHPDLPFAAPYERCLVDEIIDCMQILKISLNACFLYRDIREMEWILGRCNGRETSVGIWRFQCVGLYCLSIDDCTPDK
jgi:hypothetical protein